MTARRAPSTTRRCALLVLAALVAPAIGARDSATPHRRYLAEAIGLVDRDIRRLEAGEPVSAALEVDDGTEIVTFGAIRIEAPPSRVIEYLSRVPSIEAGLGVESAGPVGVEPRHADFAAMTLDPGDVASLARCVPTDCAVQLPAWAMSQFRDQVVWRSDQQYSSANQVARQVALQTVRQYREAGWRGLSAYDDRHPSASPSLDVQRLLAEERYLPAPLTALRKYLTDYPRVQLTGTQSRLYWAKVDAGMKPTVRISHLVTASPPALDAGLVDLAGVVVTTQLFATHYFSASLEWQMVVQNPARPNTTYLYDLTQSRAPGLTGLRGRLMRSVVEGRGRDYIETSLRATRAAVERD